MKEITLGSTGLRAVQNGFGALPIQRVSKEEAVALLRRARGGGMRFFDTARSYTDSEEKLGLAFGGAWDGLILATKTHAKTPEDFWRDLRTSLDKLRTDCIDIYQFHLADQCYRPGDGTGMYEAMLEAKAQGLIRHIGLTAHKLHVAQEAAASGLYETVQFPFSYLSGEKELELVRLCRDHQVGFIAMKALAGGLITRADAAMAFMDRFDNVMPIWGIQRMEELEQWLSFMEHTPTETEEMHEFFLQEQQALSGEFCRSCGYCMPCPVGIQINQCARMSLLLRRSPSATWLSERWQAEMARIPECLECRQCVSKCPYGLDTPTLLKHNYEDYKLVLAGERSV